MDVRHEKVRLGPQIDSEVSRSFVRTPQPAGVLEAGYGFGGRDLRGVANRWALREYRGPEAGALATAIGSGEVVFMER